MAKVILIAELFRPITIIICEIAFFLQVYDFGVEEKWQISFLRM
jgi:hypothetical protein